MIFIRQIHTVDRFREKRLVSLVRKVTKLEEVVFLSVRTDTGR